jgi:hypothetical protein
MAVAIPFYSYFILRRKFNSYDSAAIAAAMDQLVQLLLLQLLASRNSKSRI